jgi:1-phosphatidylinositol phosphodiesterase
MNKFPDSTKLVSMNLPGVHDAATWNYTQTTQNSYLTTTGPIPPSFFYMCQENSIFDALNDGVRVFDLRYGYGPSGSKK